jgi:esterase/lipase superfamily enzyme
MNQLALQNKTRIQPRVWAIETENSSWISLIPGKSAADMSHLTFEVQGLEKPLRSTETNNALSIAKIYNKLSNETISGLAASIKEIKKIKKNDFVIRTADKELMDIGLVTNKVTKLSSKVELDIEWKEEVFGSNAELPLIAQQDIQEFHPRMLFGTEDPALVKLEQKLSELGLDGSTQVAYESISEYKSMVGQVEQMKVDDNIVEVFFGTNRNHIATEDINKQFGNKQSDALILGFCEVSIPKEHVQGVMERPFKFLKIEFPEWLTDHIVMTKVENVAEDHFLSRVNEKIVSSQKKDALIFIHGFNTSFAEAARRTAQISFDLLFKGSTGFFSWPSTGSRLSYLADGDKAEASAPDFSTFLMKILNGTEIERLHIIAHSMGSRVLTFSLKDLDKDISFQQKAHIMQQIILGAPDIDQTTFKNTLLPAFKKMGKARTLYSSDRDFPINISELVRGGRPRLGDAGESIFVEEGLDTIETSKLPTKDSHGYLFNTKEVLTDIFYMIVHGHGPLERRLTEVKKGPLKYWHFPH